MTTASTALASLLALALAAAPVAAQQVTPLRTLLARPADATRSIAAGETKTAALSERDAMLADSTYANAWYFTGTKGQRVRVALSSAAFDTYLFVAKQGDEEPLEENDDSDGTNSEITLVLPADGQFVIVASSFEPRSTGEYRLALEVRDPAPGMSGPVTPLTVLLREAEPMQRIGANQRFGSQITDADEKMDDGARFEVWYVTLAAGETLSLALESREFPGLLHAGPQGGTTLLVSSALTGSFSAPAAGVYAIIVQTTGSGSYVLDLKKGTTP